MLSCRKLEATMQARKNWTGLGAAGRSFGAGQGHANSYGELAIEADRSPSAAQGNEVRQ